MSFSGVTAWSGTAPGNLLYALADEEIRIYKLLHDNPAEISLARIALLALPERGGHDLYPVPRTNFLSVSTESGCWLFDRESFSFEPHPVLADSSRVKSLAVHPLTRPSFLDPRRPERMVD